MSGINPRIPESETLRIRSVCGEELKPWLDEAARLRIRVFREFPYLYDGDPGYEREYLSHYQNSGSGILVLALDGEQVVGVSTGLALTEADPAFKKPFSKVSWRPEQIFYCGESVLEPAYRGRGLGHRFFDYREQHARSLGYLHCVFCAVVRPPDHPRRPGSYRPLDPFWSKRGYRMLPGIQCRLEWKTIDSEAPVPHQLQFWHRELQPQAANA